MLQPDNRLTLLDALRPPPGYTVDRAIGTTYSLDLQAMLTAPAAFALVQASAAGEPDAAPIELLDSIRRHARRILIFCQGGQIAPPAQTRLLPFLEESVIPVRAPGGGVFHPKVWVLRFIAQDGGDVRHRLLVATRNLTFDRSWDTVLRLDEARGETEGHVLESLAPFVRRLPDLAVQPVSAEHRDAITVIAEDLARVSFAAPPHVTEMRFHAIGHDGIPSWPFPAEARRLFVCSPFLDASFVGRLPQTLEDSTLLSRPESMDTVGAAPLADFSGRFVLSSEATFSDDSDQGPELSAPPDDPRWPLAGLHAKLFVVEGGAESQVFTGSANATTAAFSRNVEALVELRGPRRHLGVDAFLDAPDGEVALRSLMVPYTPQSDDGIASPMSVLDELRLQIGGLTFRGVVTPQDVDDAYCVRYEAENASGLPSSYAIRCWPVTLPSAAARPLTSVDGALGAEFIVSFDHLSAFLAIELDDGESSTQFVVPVALEGLPSDRENRLLRVLIGSMARLLAYLLMLLSDESVDRYDIAELVERLNRGGGTDGTAIGLPLVETMLAAVRRDPERLRHVESLVADLRASEEGRALLPTGFEAVWDAIWLVAQEQRP